MKSIGIHRNLPASEYHAVDAASASRLRIIHTSTPRHLRQKLDHPEPPTVDMIIGTLVHHRILEPTKLPEHLVVTPPEFAVVPDDYKGGKDKPKPGESIPWAWKWGFCQKWREQQESAGFVVLSQDDIDTIDAASESIQRHPEARELFEGAETEVSLFWRAKLDGQFVDCKARLDALPAGEWMPDLKTCADASKYGFQRSAMSNGYPLQCAFYDDGWRLLGDNRFKGFKFVAYEKPSRLVNVHRCTPELMAWGREKYMAALATYIRCVSSGEWPGYVGEVEFDLPAWAGRENE